MAEVLVEYPDTLAGPDGVTYRAQACGALGPDGLWEGWIEFLPTQSGKPIRSPRETTQPNHADAVYWATGLTTVYLEGALKRALNPAVVREVRSPKAYFDAPAPETAHEVAVPTSAAVLDPFSVYEKGEALLRNALGALSAWHLVNIVAAYRLSDEPITVLNQLRTPSLIERIVTGVRTQLVR